jgi:F-type H+-transporting ATPase subunit epsilon
MATTAVEVVSPAKVLYTGEAEMVVTKTVTGEIAFLAEHIPFLGALQPCLTRLIAENGDEVRLAITGGFVEVRDNRVVILADDAVLGSDVDVEAARADLRTATDRLRDDAEDAEAAALLAAAEARLEAAGVASSG